MMETRGGDWSSLGNSCCRGMRIAGASISPFDFSAFDMPRMSAISETSHTTKMEGDE